MTSDEDSFSWDDGEVGKDVVISFDDEDHRELERIAAKATDALTDVIPRLARSTALQVVKTSIRQWRENRYIELRQIDAFRSRLEDRWGEGLDLLRLLLDVGREVGTEYHEALIASRARKNRNLHAALSQLHIRACQVAYEIVTLLENGFADGAMARWRTLHEIATVALVIGDGGDEVAKRYLAYNVVEAKKALDQYDRDYESLGYPAPSAVDRERTLKAYNAAIKQFGEAFGQSYGWAAEFLKLKSPRFTDIQKAAGRSMMQSHYKLASYNVHASPQSVVSSDWNCE